MKRILVVLVVLAGCVPPSKSIDGSLVLIADGGPRDAGTVLDAGQTYDAGTPKPFDAGDCSIQWLAPPAQLAASPRADEWAELLALEGSMTDFVVSDATYARADAEWSTLLSLVPDAKYLPRNVSGLFLKFDDADAAELSAGQYHAWDCLNWAYRGAPGNSWGNYGYVDVQPVVNSDELAQLYLSLPHIVGYELNGVFTATSCGGTADTCVARDDDAGTWSWLGYTENASCDGDWFRMTTEADGGAVFEMRPKDAGIPWPWLIENEHCRQRLRQTASKYPDAGP